MERPARILVVGIGGVGATWASHAHRDGPDGMDLMIVDADPRSFEGRDGAHRIRLGAEGDDAGCAALPELAEQRLRLHVDAVEAMASTMELVIVIAALGGGVGSGATKELVDAVRRTGALVIALTAMPFPSRSARGTRRIRPAEHPNLDASHRSNRFGTGGRRRSQTWL